MSARKKILIVDDEPINLDFFDVMLTKLGFSVEKADDGLEALEKAKRFYPDLILLDNIMPKMSGWELTKILKGDPKFREIPIIMLSALDDVKDKVEGFELGVEDYITKPFNFSEVLARIRAVLRNHELYSQIAVRDSRLILAEELNADMKHNLGDFIKNIDELEGVIDMVSREEMIDENTLPRLLRVIREKTGMVRKSIAELDARIERTAARWEVLKKDEIGLTALEYGIPKSLVQE
jgi:DNA-binding response OmpR family regulator